MKVGLSSRPYEANIQRCLSYGVLTILCGLAFCSPASAQDFWSREHQNAADWVRWSLEEVHGPRVRAAKDLARCSWVRRQQLHQYGLKMNEPCATVDAETPLVILVHGLNACHESNWRLLPPTTPCERWCGSFAYPNDQSLEESARFLSCELKRLREAVPERSLVLVTHSMGGLVARACIEDPDLNPGGVRRLIMVAPPNHGSHLARFAVSPDLWEHWLGRTKGGPWRRSVDAMVDGLGEAASDLVPGSLFLTELNRRERAEGVEYTILLGTAGGGVRPWHLSLARAANRQLARRKSSAAPWCDLADEWLGELDEIVRGRGDGAVSVERGRLEGVPDTHLFDFQHVRVNNPDSDEIPTGIQRLIAERLELELPAE